MINLRYYRAAFSNLSLSLIISFFGLGCAFASSDQRNSELTNINLTKDKKPLPQYLTERMANLGLDAKSAIYIRVFKQENLLEIWKESAAGYYRPIAFYDICKQSGQLGQKRREGDHQVPEGFYTLSKEQLHPKSNYHLAFNIGYPNLRDRNNDYTGSLIMVHGKCLSVGCLAMGDDKIEEIYAFVREAFDGGAKTIPFHIFPFKMSDEKMAEFANHPELPFWQQLKPAYDLFQSHYLPARTVTCGKNYGIVPANDREETKTICAKVNKI